MKKCPSLEHYLKYRAYLFSNEWREKRVLVFERAGGVCESCGTDESLEVHHLTYDRVFAEELKDLQSLCRDCHQEEYEAERKREAVATA